MTIDIGTFQIFDSAVFSEFRGSVDLANRKLTNIIGQTDQNATCAVAVTRETFGRTEVLINLAQTRVAVVDRAS